MASSLYRDGISKMTRACATWGTGSLGPDVLVNTVFFQISPSRSSYAVIHSVSRSPRTDNISTTSSSTSPPVLPPVSSVGYGLGSSSVQVAE